MMRVLECSYNALGGDFCLVDELEVSENKEALIVLAGTVAGAAASFVAALPLLPLSSPCNPIYPHRHQKERPLPRLHCRIGCIGDICSRLILPNKAHDLT